MLTLLGWLLGVANGVRHALEPDHVAAISTLVAEQDRRRGVTFAGMWGLGHGAVLFAVGSALVLSRAQMPARVEQLFELAVALMLVLLGGRAIRAAMTLAHKSVQRSGLRQPLFIGVMHGLAGSGALTALIASQMPSVAAGLLTLVLYGLGATLGMMLLATAASVPLARLTRTPRQLQALLGVTGALSLVIGVIFGAQAIAALTT